MFGFLKRKLSDVVKKFSKDVEEESEVIEKEITKDITEDVDKVVEKVSKKDKTKENIIEEKEEKEKEQKKEEKEKESEKSETKKVEKVERDKQDNKKVEKTKVKHDDDELDELVEEESQDVEKDKLKVEEKIYDVDVGDDAFVKDDVADKNVIDEAKDDEDDVDEIEQPKKKGFFSRFTETFTKIKLSDEKFEELFWELEVALLENNVALEVIQKIKDDLKNELTQEKISRKNTQEIILDSLHKSIKEVLSVKEMDLLSEIKKKKPYIIAVIGVNGSGKTTTIAKLCHYLKKQNKKIVLAAADTFRAAAIQQIEHHAQNLDIKLIKHDYNSDPSAVAFDAIKHAEAKNLDIVIIDTAGRLHSNDNLMNELKKLVRVNKPDLKLFVGESITGNDCVEQAKKYDEIIGIDAIILSKADVDEKGGAALSISYVTKKPVLFIGTGQTYDDLEVYDKDKILKNLGI